MEDMEAINRATEITGARATAIRDLMDNRGMDMILHNRWDNMANRCLDMDTMINMVNLVNMVTVDNMVIMDK